MQSFLEKTVQHIYASYGENSSDLCIVLPNRRAGLFLKTHLSRHMGTTFWVPEVYATEDFVALLSELELPDTTTLLFELFETVKTVNPQQSESFDEFYKWGQILLNDFNEIDRYLIDTKQLFGNLNDIKELETWSLNKEEELTDFQKQYLHFWQSLELYYNDFKNRLLSKKQAYQGLAYKIVAENIHQKINKHGWKKIIFAGFNALNKAEEQMMDALVNADKAEIIWDVDAYYANDSKQEAGKFFRKYRERSFFIRSENAKKNNILFEEKLLATDNKRIEIIGASKNVAQAKLAGHIIEQLQQQHPDLQNTALVLADENLLFPVLHSLPENISDVNITMGYPLKNTAIAGYFDLLFQLHTNAILLNNGKAKYSFYHKDLLNLLNHPYTKTIAGKKTNHQVINNMVQTIYKKNILFAAITTIEKLMGTEQYDLFEKFKPLLLHWQTPQDALKCARYMVEVLKDGIIREHSDDKKNTGNLELEYLFAYTKIIKRTEALITSYPSDITDIKTLNSILKQIVRSTTLPFYGEPLMGLQIMGMLETRTLDFENIILLSCNENILPSGKSSNTFIPYELKNYFGLPTHRDKDAIFAYHFYRLLQRAKNIYLLYNTETDVFGMAEKSRFLTQLIYELPKTNANVSIKESLFSIPVTVAHTANEITIKKSADILEKLQEKALSGFSPSLINRYINCTLQFYFQAIAGLKEAEEVEETIGAQTIGNVIHEVLQQLYTPFIDKKLKAQDVKEMKAQVKTLSIAGFEKHYGNSDSLSGKNLLVVKIAQKFINNFLDVEIRFIETNEKQGVPLIIKNLEQPLSHALTINNQHIEFKGTADRVDAVGKQTRIIDYKTGKAENKELMPQTLTGLKNDTTYAKSFQLLMYAWMYYKNNPQSSSNLMSGIITFRELGKGLKTVQINNQEDITPEVLNEFEMVLREIITEIFDVEKTFHQTSERDNCRYCSYKVICNR